MADGVSYTGAAARHRTRVDEAEVRKALSALRECDVSFFRDGGDKFGVSRFAKTIAPEYGIDMRIPDCIVHRAGYYGELYGRAYRDMTEARELIRETARRGADFIKIAVSGMLDFKTDGHVMDDAINKAEIRELVRISAGEGLSVMAHCNGAENIKNALEAGISSLEHGFWIDREGMDMLIETETVWVPTLAPVACLLEADAEARAQFSENALLSIISSHRAALEYARDAGALIACGSDSGAYMVPHGRGTDSERDYLAELKIDPSAANARVAEIFKRR